VKRDEQIATIETDKIDVQVNSSDSGFVKGLFFAEGDTVSVGGNLFEIELGENKATEPKETIVEATSEAVKITETAAATPTIKETAAEKKIGIYTRVPLIKFLGPRSGIVIAESKVSKLQKSNPTGKPFILYDSINQLPKRYQQIPFTEAEMNAIDVIYY
jgi:pyruvate/2-oxoglutarate dehydrogenase complex dihydrolipoamide acyltransferase (E2) component